MLSSDLMNYLMKYSKEQEVEVKEKTIKEIDFKDDNHGKFAKVFLELRK